MEWLTDPNAWIGLLTLTVLELVLGIDNIVFISILSGKLPAHQQKKARTIGLSLAMIMRILLLLSIPGSRNSRVRSLSLALSKSLAAPSFWLSADYFYW